MSKKYRKVLAAILASAMVLGNGIAVSAASSASGSANGTGNADVPASKDVFSVVLPTNAGTQFNYILDPVGVIASTDFAKYGGSASASFVDGETMYFRNKPASGSNVATYSNVSDPITAYNKSNFDVDITVTAKVATPSGIILATGSQINASTATPSIYIALKASDSNGANVMPITTQGIVATSSIASASDAYVTTYSNVDKKYKYELNATASNIPATSSELGTYFQAYSFMLTGDCNKTENWIGLQENPPTVSLVWTIEKPAGAASGSGSSTSGPVTFTNTGVITLTGLTGAKNFAHRMTLSWDNITSDNLDSDPNMAWDITQWSETNGGTLSFTLSNEWVTGLRGKLVTVTVYLTDNSTITATTQF